MVGLTQGGASGFCCLQIPWGICASQLDGPLAASLMADVTLRAGICTSGVSLQPYFSTSTEGGDFTIKEFHSNKSRSFTPINQGVSLHLFKGWSFTPSLQSKGFHPFDRIFLASVQGHQKQLNWLISFRQDWNQRGRYSLAVLFWGLLPKVNINKFPWGRITCPYSKFSFILSHFLSL